MHVVIFYDQAQDKRVHIVQSLIQKHGCEVNTFLCDELWLQNKYQNPVAFLNKGTHFLFILEDEPLNIQAFIFYSGFAIGRALPVLLLTSSVTINLPNILNHFVVTLGITSFESYFIKEKARFESEVEKNFARQTLLDKGYAVFDSNFVLAVQNNELDIVELFLKAGFQPNTCDALGTPVLSLAVRDSLHDMAKLLVSAGANVNQVSKDRKYSPLMDAVQIGDFVNTNLLLQHAANPDLQSEDGQTALILAVGRQDKQLVAILMKYGADPAIKDKLGMSALKYAEVFGKQDILKVLKR
ncbi:MAG: ankyrin repeat domain-containing protein [Treponemataceae bacterium]